VRHIYVSPHADDVALSCGGRILTNPDRRSDTLVLTIFTSKNASKQASTRAQTHFVDAIHADREEEDEAAWNSVNVPWQALGLPEALLRGSFPFTISRSARDRQVMHDLYERIASYKRTYTEAQFYFPAGIGGHLDHLLCRDVALELLRNDASAKVLFYEDAPYWWLRFLKKAYYHELELRAGAHDSADQPGRHGIHLFQYLLRENVPFPRGKKLFLAVYVALLVRAGRGWGGDLKAFRRNIMTTIIDSEILARKRELVYHYRSQLPMLFGEAPDELLDKYLGYFGTETIIELIKRST